MKKRRQLRSNPVQEPAKGEWNKKVAANRGSAWHKNMLAGRIQVALNPTRLRILRMEQNVHQTVVAGKLGLTASTYGDIERGKRPVQKSKALEIAKIFNAQVSSLFKPFKNSRKKFVALPN